VSAAILCVGVPLAYLLAYSGGAEISVLEAIVALPLVRASNRAGILHVCSPWGRVGPLGKWLACGVLATVWRLRLPAWVDRASVLYQPSTLLCSLCLRSFETVWDRKLLDPAAVIGAHGRMRTFRRVHSAPSPCHDLHNALVLNLRAKTLLGNVGGRI